MSDQRIEQILNLITMLAAGDLDARTPYSNQHDDLDAIIAGLNMLAEELKRTTISRDKYKTTQEKLQEKVVELEAVINAFTDVYFWLDTSGIIVGYHAKQKSDLFVPPEEFMGKRMQEVFPSEVGNQFQKSINQILNGEQLNSIEYRLSVNGEEKIFEARLVPLINNRILCIIRDITQSWHLEEQLRQSQKMEALGTLSGGIAHDFNNILGAILGNAEMYMIKTPDYNEGKQYLENIYKSGQRAANLVSQIMTFSRMEMSHFKPLNLALVVQEALKMVRATIPANIEIHQSFPENCPVIKADATQIHQIILNLCSNAYHAMEEAGGILEVEIEVLTDPHSLDVEDGTRSLTKCLKLLIKDSGKGINTKDLERIFDPFFTTKEIGKGTGLGLAVVHGIVKKHQGQITVESKTGQGTTFSILFPSIEGSVEEPAIQEGKNKSEKDGSSMQHILIVEDEPILVDVYQYFLEMNGYTVTVCRSGAEALALFETNPKLFDLVLTDHAMPKMTGKQLVPKLLTIRPGVPIILSTGHSDLITEEEAHELGICKFLMKPIKLDLLQETIEEYLK